MISPPRPLSLSPTLALSACVLFLAAPAVAADLAPSWMALPDETVLMARVPGGEAFVDALRTQTRLGAVLLSADRLDRLTEIFREQSPETWDTVREALGRVELKPDDWQGVFHGDVGAALTLHPRGERLPLFVVLGWLEPGEELAPRLLAALGTALSEQADSPNAAIRKDIELAGHEVTHIVLPIVGLSAPIVPDDFDASDNSPEKIQQQVEKFKERLKDAKLVATDRVHVLVSRLGGRIVWACTVPQSAGEVRQKSDAEREAIDWDTLTGLEEATAVFGRFLSAHEGAGQPPQLVRAAGLEASLPGGVPLVEIMADPRPLLPLAERSPNPKTKQMLEALGANGLGPIAVRLALDGSTLRSGAFLSMPSPRPGLLALIDQPPIEPELPAWVPASAIGYQQISFDMGDLYKRAKALVVELSGDNGRQTFDQLENLAKTFLQLDLNDLLASLEPQFSTVTFEPRLQEAPPGNDGGDGDATSAGPQLIQRVGIVCRIKDEDLWKKLLDVGSRFAQGRAGGGLQAVEEQGFRGYRVEQGANQVGIFVGNGYLVIGIGPEVSESLLSVLRTAPEGAAALRASGLVERGRALISPQPCLIYELEDAGASVKLTRQVLETLLNTSLGANLPQAATGYGPGKTGYTPAAAIGANKELVEKLKKLLPSDAELEGVMGVSVSQTVATDDGLVMQSALELPAP